jgi:hypothetical protein
VDEIRKLKNKIQNMDKDLIRVTNERNKWKVECAGIKDEVRRMRKRMNADERNNKADKERMRKRMNDCSYFIRCYFFFQQNINRLFFY